MPTTKTIIGTFSNTEQLDIFQILGKGNQVVCGMAFDGSIYSVAVDDSTSQATDAASSAASASKLQRFLVNYTFTDQDQNNGYAFVPCPLPIPYSSTNYWISCTLQNNNVGGGWLVFGYIAGTNDPYHGIAPTSESFNAVLLNINGSGIVAGQSVILYCVTYLLD